VSGLYCTYKQCWCNKRIALKTRIMNCDTEVTDFDYDVERAAVLIRDTIGRLPFPGFYHVQFDDQVFRDQAPTPIKRELYGNVSLAYDGRVGDTLQFDCFIKTELMSWKPNAIPSLKPRLICSQEDDELAEARGMAQLMITEVKLLQQFVVNVGNETLLVINYAGRTVSEFVETVNVALAAAEHSVVMGVMGDDVCYWFKRGKVYKMCSTDLKKAEGSRHDAMVAHTDKIYRGYARKSNLDRKSWGILNQYLSRRMEGSTITMFNDVMERMESYTGVRNPLPSGSSDTGSCNKHANLLIAVVALQRKGVEIAYEDLSQAATDAGYSLEDSTRAGGIGEFCGHFIFHHENEMQMLVNPVRILRSVTTGRADLRKADYPARKLEMRNMVHYLGGASAPFVGLIAEDHSLDDKVGLLRGHLRWIPKKSACPYWSPENQMAIASLYDVSYVDMLRFTLDFKEAFDNDQTLHPRSAVLWAHMVEVEDGH